MAALGIGGAIFIYINPGSVLHRVGQCSPKGNQVSDLRHPMCH